VSETGDARFQLVHPLLTAWRAPGVLQVGFDERSFVLNGVPEQLPRALELLVEPRTAAEVAARVPGLGVGWVRWLCEHLSTAHLLTSTPSVVRPSVLVYGAGRLATATMSMLRAGGLSPRPLLADPDILPEGALVVVAAGTAEPDRTLLNRLAEAGTEHLVVRAEPTRAVVGPLVSPATGPCVRCDDLARARLDRSWPILLAQLCRTPARPDVGLANWAAATASAQVRSRLAGMPSELVGRSLELGIADFRLRARTWPVQPECGLHPETLPAAGTLAG